MTLGIALLLLVSLVLAGLLTLTPRPFEVGTLLLALACGTVTTLLTEDVFLGACAGALTACASLTLKTMFETFAALDLGPAREVPRVAHRPSDRGSNDERAGSAA